MKNIMINGSRTILVTSCIFLTGAATGAPNDSRFPISIAEAEERFQTHFAKMDSDQSGTVDLAEFEAAKRPKHARRAGAHNGKYKHHKKKRRHHRSRASAATKEMREAIKAETFTIMDANNDGSLSAEEFAASSQRKVRRTARKRVAFRSMDADADNLLTIEELRNPTDRLRQADTDGDGLVTKVEMKALRKQFRAARSAEQSG